MKRWDCINPEKQKKKKKYKNSGVVKLLSSKVRCGQAPQQQGKV